MSEVTLTREDAAIYARADKRSATLQRLAEREQDDRIDADLMAYIDDCIRPDGMRWNLRAVFKDNGRFR